MAIRVPAARRGAVVSCLGVAQLLSWASSYYLPGVIATPMARDLGFATVWSFGAFSCAMVLSAFVAPVVGRILGQVSPRSVLMVSNGIFAAGLVALGLAQGLTGVFVAWALIGIGMGAGLYETAFASVVSLYGRDSRGAITGITLFAGFAITLGWPLSGWIISHWGWREVCLFWAALQIVAALPLNALLPKAEPRRPGQPPQAEETQPQPGRHVPWLLAFIFGATWFNVSAMAAHLPALLQAAGASTAASLAAGALIGPAQVAARALEFGFLQGLRPVVLARLAALAHPVAATVLLIFGGPGATVFAIIHGAGNGVLTISKGTLPLALFGTAGYGNRLMLLGAPARLTQAAAPVLFGSALSIWGLWAILGTAGLGLAATAALFCLGRPRA